MMEELEGLIENEGWSLEFWDTLRSEVVERDHHLVRIRVKFPCRDPVDMVYSELPELTAQFMYTELKNHVLR